MPIRFRRTLKIAPGVKLNFSKSGVSTTVGPKGFHFTFGKRGVRRTVSIPGTGVSEVDYINKKGETKAEKEQKESAEARREETAAEHGEEKSESRAGSAENRHVSRRRKSATANTGSAELRNAFVLLGIVIFFFAGAAALGLIPAHFFSNSLLYITHLVQSTGL